MASGCWAWRGYADKDSYGQARGFQGQTEQAHRVIYKLLVGAIPTGMTLDHRCKNRTCVRPEHLRVVPHEVNASRRLPEPLPPGQLDLFEIALEVDRPSYGRETGERP